MPVLEQAKMIRRIRLLLGVFVIGLIASGVTAFFLASESRLLTAWFGDGTRIAAMLPGLAWWLTYVQQGLEASGRDYPFLAYGTDWPSPIW
jgi:hypothetical protein